MQENTTHNHERFLPVEIDLEMTQVLELPVKDFKTAFINKFTLWSLHRPAINLKPCYYGKTPLNSYVHLILRELNVSYFMIFFFKIKNKKSL